MSDMSLDNRHKWALPYWARPGIALAKGAGKGGSSRRDDDDDPDDDDEDEDDPDDDPDDEDEDEDDPDDLADMDEDELREELRKTREQLNRSTSGSAAKRKRIKDLRRQLADSKKPAPKSTPKAGDKGGKGDAEPVDPDAIRAAVESEATTKANERIVKAEARGALKGVLGANATKGQVSKLVGMLDLKDIDVDDDGEVDEDAIEDAIEALRKDWPQLFPDKGKRTPRQRVAGDKDATGRRSASGKKPTATELQVAAALGKPIRR